MTSAGRRATQGCMRGRKALDEGPKGILDGVVTRNLRETADAEIADGAMMGTRNRVVGAATAEDLGHETGCITFFVRSIVQQYL